MTLARRGAFFFGVAFVIAIQAFPDPLDLQEAQTKVICAATTPATATLTQASRFAFQRVDAFPCIRALLEKTKTLDPADNFRNLVAPAFIWNAAEVRLGLTPTNPLAKSIDVLLQTIAGDDGHPLQSHAWLAQGLSNPHALASPNDFQVAEFKTRWFAPGWTAGFAKVEAWASEIHPLLSEQLHKYDAKVYGSSIDAYRLPNPAPYSVLSSLEMLASMPTRAATAVGLTIMQDRIQDTKLVPDATQGPPATGGPSDMQFTVTGYALAGRGGKKDFATVTTKSAANLQHPNSWLSGNGGTSSFAYFVVNVVDTYRDPTRGLVGYFGYVRYYARGGYRNKSMNESAEDETSEAAATVVGTATIPRCTDIAICKPSLIAVLDNASNATVVLTQGGTARTATVGQQITVDTTQSDTTVTVTISHVAHHVGACCEPPEAFGGFQLSLWPALPVWPVPPPTTPSPPFPGAPPVSPEDAANFEVMKPFATFGEILPFMAAKADGVIEYVPYGELLAKPSFSPLDFEHRYVGIYLRLLMADFLLKQNEIPMFSLKLGKPVTIPVTAAETSALSLARASLGTIARSTYGSYVASQLREKRSLLDRLDIKPLDNAIAALSKGQSLSPREIAAYATLIDTAYRAGSPAKAQELRREWDAFTLARGQDNILDAVISLMQFRRGYLDLIRTTEREIRILSAEATQLQ